MPKQARAFSPMKDQFPYSIGQPPPPWHDPRQIDLLNGNERRFWAKALDVRVADLFAAVDKVGTSAEKVRRYLESHPRPRLRH
jgi:hypothetical protein